MATSTGRKRGHQRGADLCATAPAAKRIRPLAKTLPAVSPSFQSELELEEAVRTLEKVDKKLASLIETYPKPTFFNDRNSMPFQCLCQSIIHQQLSVHAGRAVWRRFCALFSRKNTTDKQVPISEVTPERLLRFSHEKLRNVGLSQRKAEFVRDIAKHSKKGLLDVHKLESMTNEEIITQLKSVRGIGVWTVHMFLIFCMRRQDVLPVGDLGVQKGFQKTYGLSTLPSATEMESLAEKWSPYRSVGTWYMWRASGM